LVFKSEVYEEAEDDIDCGAVDTGLEEEGKEEDDEENDDWGKG
jgi:hypothetical protein